MYGPAERHQGLRPFRWMDKTQKEDQVTAVFVIMQNGSPVKKEVTMSRQTLIEYNKKPKQKWAELYEMIVRDKAYISIKDLSNSN